MREIALGRLNGVMEFQFAGDAAQLLMHGMSEMQEEIYPNNGRSNKFPEITRLIDNLRRIHVLHA